MITNVQLTDSGISKLNAFMAGAKPAVRHERIAIEVCDMAAERLETGEAMIYELGGQYTLSGRPELLTLTLADVEAEEEADEE